MIKQIKPKRFPSGDPHVVLVLVYEPADLSRKFGLTFDEDYDDLDYFQYAALEHESIGQILLMRYRNCPEPGTEVHVDSSVSAFDTRLAVESIFGLTPDEITWITEK